MNKDIQNVTKEVFDLLRGYSMEATPSNILNNFCNSHKPIGTNEYSNNTIYELIVLIRLERLYDLGKIDVDKKTFLTNLYKEYLKTYELIGKDIQDEMLNSKKYDRLKHSLLRNKLNVIAEKLNEYALLEEFDYSHAFIREIDSKILTKKY